jgi:hypothetical protein
MKKSAAMQSIKGFANWPRGAAMTILRPSVRQHAAVGVFSTAQGAFSTFFERAKNRNWKAQRGLFLKKIFF